LQNRQNIHYKYVEVPVDKAFYSAVFVGDGHYINCLIKNTDNLYCYYSTKEGNSGMSQIFTRRV